MDVLGIHTGHDSGAALVHNGEVVAAANEERFVGVKHYTGLPFMAARYCLEAAGIPPEAVDVVAVASKSEFPELIFLIGQPDRNGQNRTRRRVAAFLRENLGTRRQLPAYMHPLALRPDVKIVHVEHHLAHAASAYYPGHFHGPALLFTMDGEGDDTCTAVWQGDAMGIRPLLKVGREGSFGFFYSIVTEALGWWIGDGEGKTMGLAPYGEPACARNALQALIPRFREGRLSHPVPFQSPGMWMETGALHWHTPESEAVASVISSCSREGLAAAAQELLEEQVTEFVRAWVKRTGLTQAGFAGGLFLNVKLNQRLWETGGLSRQFIFPHAGDGGLPVGAALYAGAQEDPALSPVPLEHLYWGPAYDDATIEKILRARGLAFQHCEDIAATCAQLLARNRTVAWFQGRMEFGPRALGNRSILVDPRNKANKDRLNATIKFREPFRPFCPSLLGDAMETYLLQSRPEPYMITSFAVRPERAAEIPAVVHVDSTVRPQSVERKVNPRYWDLIRHFGEITGVPVILNTSLNLNKQPILNTPQEAIACFYNSGLDHLALGNYLLSKHGI